MSELKIGQLTLGMCGTNCYFLYREGSKDVIFVDPAEQGAMIYNKLNELGFNIKAIFLTHGHFDHIMGCDEMRNASKAPIYAPLADKVLLEDAEVNYSANWAFPYTTEADEYFEDGAEYDIAGIHFRIISTPGHTIGSCCLYFEEDKVLLSGDTLFYQSVGRTDLPTGSMKSLVESVRNKLFTLPDDVRVYPGHGSATDIASEKTGNMCV